MSKGTKMGHWRILRHRNLFVNFFSLTGFKMSYFITSVNFEWRELLVFSQIVNVDVKSTV